MADMTKRDFLKGVIELGGELGEFAQTELEKMDNANAKRREKASEKNAEKIEEVKAFVAGHLNGEAKTATMLKDELVAEGFTRADGKDVNVQFVSAMCRKAVDLGIAVATEVKISGKGIQKAYTLV